MALPKVGVEAVITNLSAFSQGAKLINKSFDAINVKMDAVSKGSSGVTKALTAVGAGIANVAAIAASAAAAGIAALTAGIIALGVASIKTGAEFTKEMSNVGAISGATAEEFEALTKSAEDLGRTTKFTATEAAEGMTFLAQAGFETAEIIGAMPGVLDLAAASNLGLGRSADIVSNILRGFDADVSETGKFVDILTATFTSSNTNLSQLGDAMKFVAPVAKDFGIDVADTAAAIGKMGDAGIQGTMAGTTLRRMLLNLAAPTKKSKELMDELGIEVFNLDGSMKTLPEIVGEVSGKLSVLGEEQRIAATKTIIGVRAIAGFNVLAGEGQEALEDYGNELRDSVGIAGEIATKQLDNLSGDMTLLTSAFDGLKIDIFRKLEPLLRSIVQFATKMIPLIGPPLVKLYGFLADTATPIINKIMAAFEMFFDTIESGRSIFDAAKISLLSLVPPELRKAVNDLINAFGGFFSTIFGGEGGLSDFEFSFEGISKVITNVANFVLPLLTKALNFLGPIIRNVIDIVGNLFAAFQEGGISGVFDELFGDVDAGGMLKSFIDPIIAQVGPILGDLIDTMSQFISDNWPKIQEKLTEWADMFFDWVVDTVIPSIPGILDGIVETITTWATEQGPKIQEEIAKWQEGFWDWVQPIIDDAGTILAGVVAAIGVWATSAETQAKLAELGKALGAMLVTGIENLFANQAAIAEVLLKIIGGLAAAVVIVGALLIGIGAQIVAGIIAGIIEKVTGGDVEVALISNLGEMLSGLGSQIKTIASLIGRNIILGIVGGLLNIIKKLDDAWKKITDFFKTNFENLVTLTTGFVNEKVEFWQELFRTLTEDIIPKMWESIKTIFTTSLNTIKTVVNQKLDEIKNFFTDKFEQVKTIVSTTFENIKTIISTIMDTAKGLISTAIQTIVDTFNKLKEIADGVKEAFEDAVGEVKTGLTNMINAVVNKISDFIQAGKDLIAGIGEGINAGAGVLVDIIKDAIQAAIDAATDLLGIGSPSKVFFNFGEDVMLGLQQGLAAMTPAINAQFQASIVAPAQAAISGPVLPSVVNNSITVNTGGNTINTPFDQVQFDARVMKSIQRQLG